MSKSLNNTILLSDQKEEVEKKLRKAVTDPQKLRRNDPGRPDVCLVFTYHNKFNPSEVDEIRSGCESGALGCVDCKMKCSQNINVFLEPIIEKRNYFDKNLDEVKDILKDGELRGKKVAEQTMDDVHKAMKFG